MFEVQKKYRYILMLDGFSLDFLSSPEKQADLKAMAQELAYNREYGTAQDVYLRLKETEGIASIKGMNEVLRHYQAASLPVLTSSEAIRFIEAYTVWALRHHYSLSEEVVDHLLFYMDYVTLGETQDELVKKIRNNQEKIGDGVDFFDSTFIPTVQRWLSEFDNAYPIEEKRGRLEEISFMNQTQFVRRLDEEDNTILQELLEFYDIILFGRRDVYVSEEEERFRSKTEATSVDTFVQPVTPAEGGLTASPLTDALLHNYVVRAVNWQEVVVRAQELLQIAGDTTKFQLQFHQAINQRDSKEIAAYLFALAHQGKLDEIFEYDKKVRDIFYKHLVKKFSAELGAHFKSNLRQPVYLSYFLQHVLKDILKFSDNESAVIAVKLTNELKRAGDKEYLPIAYGDLETGAFKWKTIIEKDDTLDLLEK